MAVQKETSTKRGPGNYWTMFSVTDKRVVDGKFTACVVVGLWPDKAHYEAESDHWMAKHKCEVVLDNIDPTWGEIEAAAEDLLMQPAVAEQLSQKEKPFRPIVKAKAATPKDPVVEADAGQKHVPPLESRRAAKAGPLAGGVRV